MINNKKKINKIKTHKFLDDFSIKFLLQHNNFSVKDWLEFKQKIQEISENSVEILNVKNSILKKSLIDSQTKNMQQLNIDHKLNSLCQGPNFLLGCKNDNSLKPLWNYLHSNSKLIIISCFYKNQLLNHLDLEILLKTDFSVYSHFFQILDKKTEFSNILQHHLKIFPLSLIQYDSLMILEILKQSKKEKC